MPSATFLGFVATFFSLALSYSLTGIRPLLIDASEFVFDYVLLAMAFGMALRHQVRVVFMDNFYVAHCGQTQSWRVEFWFVFLVSALGGITLTVYFYGGKWISSFMVLYCVMFTLFGYRVFGKMTSSIEAATGVKRKDWSGFPKEMWPVTTSLFVDVILLLLWVYWWMTTLFDGFAAPSAIDMAFALVVTSVVTIAEYVIVFHQPVKERLGDAKRMLF